MLQCLIAVIKLSSQMSSTWRCVFVNSDDMRISLRELQFLGMIFPFKYQTHSAVLWLHQVDLCFDYLLPVGETLCGFDQSLLSQTSGCVLFIPQSRAAGVRDSSTAPAANWSTTHAPRSHVPTAGCVYRRLKVTCATAQWTTLENGKHTNQLIFFT